MNEEHEQWEREHRAHLSAIETPASQRPQANSDDEGFIASDGDETIFDSQDSDYRASASEESFHTVSEANDSEYQDRLAIVVRNSVEEVANDNEPKPSESEEAEGEVKCDDCGAVHAEGKPDPRSAKKKPAKAASAASGKRSKSRSKPADPRYTSKQTSKTQKGKGQTRKQRTRKRREHKTKHSSRRYRYKPRRQEFNNRRFKRMGHRRAKCGKNEEGAPPYRMPERDRDYLDKLKKAERYKHKGRRRRQYLKRKRRKRRHYSSSDPDPSSSSSESTMGTSTTSSNTGTTKSTTGSSSTSHGSSDTSADRNWKSDSTLGDSDDELVGDIYREHLRERKNQVHAPTTVVYSSEDLKRVHAPTLHDGDKLARKRFRVKYLKYAQMHANVMRGRPPSHRVPPKAVVECIEPDLLQYICAHALPKKYRVRRPEKADALVVHNWVMKVGSSILDAEDSEGIAALRKLKCTIGGPGAVREVQRFFIRVRKLRKLHRVKIAEKQIIAWLSYNIKPPDVKRTIMSILRQNTKRGRLAARYLSRFHKLLMRIAKTFTRSFELGLGPRGSSSGKGNGEQPDQDDDNSNKRDAGGKSRRRGKKARKQRDGGRTGENDRQTGGNDNSGNNRRKGGGGRAGKKGPPADLECICCGENHYVSKCPNKPEARKNWTFEQWLKAKGTGDSSAAAKKRRKRPTEPKSCSESDENAGSGTEKTETEGKIHPRGGRSRAKRNAKKRSLNTSAKATGEPSKLNDDADGTVEIAGVPGVYVCDGGCDRATITKAYADKIEEAGVACHYHEKPRSATLADGSSKEIIIGFAYANLVLKTRAGFVALNDVYIDILKGEDRSRLLLLGKVEESRLGLKSYAQQLEERARESKGKQKMKFAEPELGMSPNAELTAEEVKAAYIKKGRVNRGRLLWGNVMFRLNK